MEKSEQNIIALKVGDTFRLNGARKHNTVIDEFDHDGEAYVVYVGDAKDSKLEVRIKKYLCSETEY